VRQGVHLEHVGSMAEEDTKVFVNTDEISLGISSYGCRKI
jgi:hypothetical protein